VRPDVPIDHVAAPPTDFKWVDLGSGVYVAVAVTAQNDLASDLPVAPRGRGPAPALPVSAAVPLGAARESGAARGPGGGVAGDARQAAAEMPRE
jgi:hypothetical protein